MKKLPSAYSPEQGSSSVSSGGHLNWSKTSVHRIFVKPVCINGKHHAVRSGPVYSASYLGEVIIMRSTQPALDAARILHARGLTGLLEMWDERAVNYRFSIGIASAARLTLEEGNRRPRLVQFKTFKSFDGRDTVEAFSARRGVNIATKPDEPISTLHPPVAIQG